MSREAGAQRNFDFLRLAALVRKESLQVLRDPAALLIAFILPVLLLFLFAYAVSLDVREVRIGVVMENEGAAARSLAASFAASRYFQVRPARDRREMGPAVVAVDRRDGRRRAANRRERARSKCSSTSCRGRRT